MRLSVCLCPLTELRKYIDLVQLLGKDNDQILVFLWSSETRPRSWCSNLVSLSWTSQDWGEGLLSSCCFCLQLNLHGCIIDNKWKKKIVLLRLIILSRSITTAIIVTILTKNVTDAHMPLNDIGIISIIHPWWPLNMFAFYTDNH